MSAICPLADEYLPLDASNLKIKQVRTFPASPAVLHAMVESTIEWSDHTTGTSLQYVCTDMTVEGSVAVAAAG